MIRFSVLFFSCFFCYLIMSGFYSAFAQDKSTDEILNVLDEKWVPNQTEETIRNHPFLKQLLEAGVNLVSLGHEQGFDGWLTYNENQIQVFYTVPGLDAVMTGLLIGANGENVTAAQIARYEAVSGNSISKSVRSGLELAAEIKQENTPGRVLLRAASKAVWFGYGGDRDNPSKFAQTPIVYVFMTPTCKNCDQYLEDMIEQYAQKDLIQLRIIPIYETTQGQTMVENVLVSDSPAKAWLDLILKKQQAPTQEKTQAISQQVEENKKILENRELSVYPLTLYKNATGLVKIVQGVPRDLQSLIFDLTVGNQ